jgi:apolipoprotein N-acyltransferase
MRAMMHHFWTFASEAKIAGLWGAAFMLVAIAAGIAEMRSTRRARIERVGLVPWRGIFLASAMIGTALLALAASGIASG